MRFSRALYTVSVLAALAGTLPAHAQSRSRDRDPAIAQVKRLATELQSANFHWGPFYLLSRFQLSDVGYGYDYYVPAGEETQGVSVAAAAPQKFFFVPRKKLILTAEVTPAYSLFFDGDSRGQFDYDLRGDAHILLNHVYLNPYVLLGDRLRPQAADFNRMATVRSTAAGVNGEVKFSSKTSLLLRAQNTDIAFPGARYQPADVPLGLLERDERSGRAALVHKTLPLTSFHLAVEADAFKFERASYKNGERVRVSPGLYYDGSRVDVRLEAGPTRLRFDDPAQKEFSGLTGELGVSRSVGRWGANGAFERDLGFSIMEANNYYIANRVTAGLQYAATSRLSLRLNATGERDDYPVPVRGITRRDDITFTTAGFRYSWRRLAGGVDVGPYRRTSTLGGEDESGIRYVIDLSFTP